MACSLNSGGSMSTGTGEWLSPWTTMRPWGRATSTACLIAVSRFVPLLFSTPHRHHPPQWLPPLPPIIGRHDYEIAIELLGSGTALLKDVVTHSFPLAQIQEALRTAVDKRTGAIKVQEVP